MHSGKFHFGIGLVLGVVLSALFFNFYAPRYVTTKSESGELIKQDKWSGESWRMVDNQWKKILDYSREWQQIDADLRKALNLSDTAQKKKNSFDLLRNKYPSLSKLSDDEISERIKLVYSKEILINLYLTNFNAIQKNGKATTQ